MEYTYKYKFRPRFADCDSYAIAHHSKYFCWFEEARFYFLFDCIKLDKKITESLKFPVVNIYCKYYKSVVYGNNYIVIAKIEFELNNPIIKFSYRLLSEDSKTLYAKGNSEHVTLDNEGNYVMEITEEIKEKLTTIQEKQVRGEYE